MLNDFFKIKKISDLVRLCVLPVMILSIFLSFYLYIDMEKIREKSQELVNNAIPHVLSTQQSAINLVQLKHNIELMATAPELKMARQAYVDVRALVTESEISKIPKLRTVANEILIDVNRLWKLRLQLDELRSTVNSSLHFMDTVLYLVYNDNSELFPEIDRHVSNYIDLYQLSYFNRDLSAERLFYLNLMRERLDPDFDREAFIQEHKETVHQGLNVREDADSELPFAEPKGGEYNADSVINAAVGNFTEVYGPQSTAATPHLSSNNLNNNIAGKVRSLTQEEVHTFQQRHDLQRIKIYQQEYDRFLPLWELFIKLQHVFSYDTASILKNVDDLSQSFTSGETVSLHAELSDISYLASETQPMVMVTIGFCSIGFWAVIFLLNRFIMVPLKNIARILIRFRYTKNINPKHYEGIFNQNHLLEIREIIDILPHIFQDFSSIEEHSSQLKHRYEELVVHSKYDDLTKVFNRGSLNLLIKEVGSNTPARFAVLMVDIDYFKHLNDSMGHQRGDEVLFAVAQTLQAHIAKKDMVFRYGGEEFCIILSDISQHDAFKVARRLCTTIKLLKLINEGVPSNVVTVSMGLSLVTDSTGQFRIDELISQADKALYLAKRNGRDRVVACPKKLVFGISEDLDDGSLSDDYEDSAELEAKEQAESKSDQSDNSEHEQSKNSKEDSSANGENKITLDMSRYGNTGKGDAVLDAVASEALAQSAKWEAELAEQEAKYMEHLESDSSQNSSNIESNIVSMNSGEDLENQDEDSDSSDNDDYVKAYSAIYGKGDSQDEARDNTGTVPVKAESRASQALKDTKTVANVATPVQADEPVTGEILITTDGKMVVAGEEPAAEVSITTDGKMVVAGEEPAAEVSITADGKMVVAGEEPAAEVSITADGKMVVAGEEQEQAASNAERSVSAAQTKHFDPPTLGSIESRDQDGVLLYVPAEPNAEPQLIETSELECIHLKQAQNGEGSMPLASDSGDIHGSFEPQSEYSDQKVTATQEHEPTLVIEDDGSVSAESAGNDASSKNAEKVAEEVVIPDEEVLDELILNSLLVRNDGVGIWDMDPLDIHDKRNYDPTFTDGLMDSGMYLYYTKQGRDKYLHDAKGNKLGKTRERKPNIDNVKLNSRNAFNGFMFKVDVRDDGAGQDEFFLADPEMLTVQDCIDWVRSVFGYQAKKGALAMRTTYEVLSGTRDTYKNIYDEDDLTNAWIDHHLRRGKKHDFVSGGDSELEIPNSKAQDAISELVAIKEVAMAKKQADDSKDNKPQDDYLAAFHAERDNNHSLDDKK